MFISRNYPIANVKCVARTSTPLLLRLKWDRPHLRRRKVLSADNCVSVENFVLCRSCGYRTGGQAEKGRRGRKGRKIIIEEPSKPQIPRLPSTFLNVTFSTKTHGKHSFCAQTGHRSLKLSILSASFYQFRPAVSNYLPYSMTTEKKPRLPQPAAVRLWQRSSANNRGRPGELLALVTRNSIRPHAPFLSQCRAGDATAHASMCPHSHRR